MKQNEKSISIQMGMDDLMSILTLIMMVNQT